MGRGVSRMERETGSFEEEESEGSWERTMRGLPMGRRRELRLSSWR